MTTAIPLTAFPANGDVPAVEHSQINWRAVTVDIRNGDQEAFTKYYNHYFELVFAEIRRTSGRDQATCLDIAQETFVKIIRRIKVIDDQPRLTAWTRTVARTTTYDWLRRQHRQQTRHGDYAATVDQLQSDHESSQIQDQARLVWLQSRLEQLSPDLRRLIALRYRLGWSLARIGQHVGLRSGAVDGRLRRAIAKLRQQAEAEYDD